MLNKKLFITKIVSLILPVFFCAQGLGGPWSPSCIRAKSAGEAAEVTDTMAEELNPANGPSTARGIGDPEKPEGMSRRDFLRMGGAAAVTPIVGTPTAQPKPDYTGGLPAGHPLLGLFGPNNIFMLLDNIYYVEIVRKMQFFSFLSSEKIKRGFPDEIGWSDDGASAPSREEVANHIRYWIGRLQMDLCGMLKTSPEESDIQRELSPEDIEKAKQMLTDTVFRPVAHALKALQDGGMPELADELTAVFTERAMRLAAEKLIRRESDWDNEPVSLDMLGEGPEFSGEIPFKEKRARQARYDLEHVSKNTPVETMPIEKALKKAASEIGFPEFYSRTFQEYGTEIFFKVVFGERHLAEGKEYIRARLVMTLEPSAEPVINQPTLFDIAWVDVSLPMALFEERHLQTEEEPVQLAFFEDIALGCSIFYATPVVRYGFENWGLDGFLFGVLQDISQKKKAPLVRQSLSEAVREGAPAFVSADLAPRKTGIERDL